MCPRARLRHESRPLPPLSAREEDDPEPVCRNDRSRDSAVWSEALSDRKPIAESHALDRQTVDPGTRPVVQEAVVIRDLQNVPFRVGDSV